MKCIEMLGLREYSHEIRKHYCVFGGCQRSAIATLKLTINRPGGATTIFLCEEHSEPFLGVEGGSDYTPRDMTPLEAREK